MSAFKSIHLAVEMASRQRDQVQKALVQVQRSRLFALDQMDQLEKYAVDTEARWLVSAQRGASPEMMRHHYQFMDRLRQAIALQFKVMADVDRQLEAARQQVLQAEFRVMSLKHMLAKKQAGVVAMNARREQKQMDEFASSLYARSNTRHYSGVAL